MSQKTLLILAGCLAVIWYFKTKGNTSGSNTAPSGGKTAGGIRIDPNMANPIAIKFGSR